MRFILRKDIPTLVKGETGICLDSFSIVTQTEFEGLREHSLKDLAGVPVTLLEEIRNFLNEAYADIKGFFIVKFIIDSVETPIATPNKTKVAAISIPARTGYTSAWQLNGTNYDFDALVTSDISLIAKYTAITYNISYILDGGTNDEANPETYTIETPTITLGTPTKTGYSFVGWYSEETNGILIENITKGSTGDINLYAMFEQEEENYVRFVSAEARTITPKYTNSGVTLQYSVDSGSTWTTITIGSATTFYANYYTRSSSGDNRSLGVGSSRETSASRGLSHWNTFNYSACSRLMFSSLEQNE